MEKRVFLVFSTTSFPAYTLPFLSPDQLKHATPPLLHSVECVMPDLSRLRLRPASPRRETDAAHRHTHIKVTVLSLEFTFTPSHARIRSQYTQICACKGTHMQRYKWRQSEVRRGITVVHQDQSSCLLNWQEEIDYYTLWLMVQNECVCVCVLACESSNMPLGLIMLLWLLRSTERLKGGIEWQDLTTAYIDIEY